MSLTHLSNMCSHLNNVSKARLGLTSIVDTKMHRNLILAMQQQGLIGTIVRGGRSPPPPHLLLGQPTATSVAADGSSAAGSSIVETEPVTQANIASRRLWLGLKYWQSEPVLGKITPVSKPKRRITMDLQGLRRVIRGSRSGTVDGLRSPGECLFLATDRGIMEARQCVEKKVGGLVLCRVE
ncbi:40S ribosomal protein S8 [Talaromyces stipitatus ATCC 10500]|uniref:40S ribosomal protein S8 n=1 Tax=Talaromyces stipitatus (strain ATCC 10500 / CBS 375.48 / QM 6759 / NRRL 1006) TaxID=441959 RepID=B8MGS5_TALSN|nr:mitochondrial 37S ribosomal protein MRPS8 [Talaromyces stipitatus ATCC 10500]EED16306.1 40S ribosomal protein S8 [Talaromyces stipitatus ATCC 10500]